MALTMLANRRLSNLNKRAIILREKNYLKDHLIRQDSEKPRRIQKSKTHTVKIATFLSS